MSQRNFPRVLLQSLRVLLISSVLLFQFAGAVGPAFAANTPPVITEGDLVTRVISKNNTPYAFSLTLHVTDADGDVVGWGISAPAVHGTATASGSGASVSVTYTPNTDFAGDDIFSVFAHDGNDGWDYIMVEVYVAPGIGLVSNLEGVNDKSYNEMAYLGLTRAETELGITKSLYEPVSTDDFLPKLQKCADDGNKFCFAVAWTMVDAITAAAIANPDTKFAIVEGWLPSYTDNLRGIVFNKKEAAFLAGALAGRMTGTKVIGVVGGMEIIPDVIALVEGYRNGAQCANPNVKVLIQYAGTFADPNLGAQIAQQMMAQKADVIFSAAGPTGDGAIRYSAQNGAWSIGVDVDQYRTVFGDGSVEGSAKLLSSAMNKVDNTVFLTVDDYMVGTFTPGNLTYNLAKDGVGLAPFHETNGVIPLATKTYLNNLRTKIINGTNKVSLTCRFSAKSVGSYDGWILESTETSGAGGSLNSGATTLFIGDNTQDKQYRAILSFNTSAIPDNATVTKAQIKIRSAGIVGANPFVSHSGLRFDMRNGYFSTVAGLQLPDFKATPSLNLAGAFGSTPASGWYTATLGSTAFSYVNKKTLTQFRLRFYKDDDDDLFADYLKIYSGNAALAYQPQLIISYRQP